MADQKPSTDAPDVALGISEDDVAAYSDVYVLRAEDEDDELLLPTPTAGNTTGAALFVIRADDGTSGHVARVRSEAFPIKVPLGRDQNAYTLGGFEVARLYVLNARWYILGRTNLTTLGAVGKIPPLSAEEAGAQEAVVEDLQALRRAVNQLIERSRAQGATIKSGQVDVDLSVTGHIITTAAL